MVSVKRLLSRGSALMFLALTRNSSQQNVRRPRKRTGAVTHGMIAKLYVYVIPMACKPRAEIGNPANKAMPGRQLVTCSRLSFHAQRAIGRRSERLAQ